ncbi:hypothetical protein [Oceanobacillus sojae]|uniref:Uncharacterized protein n=1 Tax=Oceanobacillus sojae TaxID=582851 RepID=A0A511ZII5_9BACI|nr:hypothetical protein [Oceanobacillus sojae]GEN87259.1 hypothetical protein OSO01_19980 [Oceanobacillus sojae]
MDQPNKDYIIQSLVNQIAESTMKIADRDAVINELHQELEETKRQQIEEMDKEHVANKK